MKPETTIPTPDASTSPPQAPADGPDAADLRARAARLDEAVAALRRAEEIRAAEGLSLGYGREAVLVEAADTLRARAEELRQSAPSLALGDPVTVRGQYWGPNARTPGTRAFPVTKVGRTLVYLNGETRAAGAYRLADGRVNDEYGRQSIVASDLHRIRRDLAPKSRAKTTDKL